MTQVTLHGIHSLPVTDSVLDGMRMSMGPGASDSHIDNYLSKIVLVELEITGLREVFDPYEIRQESESTTHHHYQDHVYLDANGTAILSEHGHDLPDDVTHFRIAIYLRHYNANEPLITQYKSFPPHAVSDMPQRLRDLTIFSCD